MQGFELTRYIFYRWMNPWDQILPSKLGVLSRGKYSYGGCHRWYGHRLVPIPILPPLHINYSYTSNSPTVSRHLQTKGYRLVHPKRPTIFTFILLIRRRTSQPYSTLRLHQYDYSLNIDGYYHVLGNDFQLDSAGQPPMHLQYVTTPSAGPRLFEPTSLNFTFEGGNLGILTFNLVTIECRRFIASILLLVTQTTWTSLSTTSIFMRFHFKEWLRLHLCFVLL